MQCQERTSVTDGNSWVVQGYVGPASVRFGSHAEESFGLTAFHADIYNLCVHIHLVKDKSRRWFKQMSDCSCMLFCSAALCISYILYYGQELWIVDDRWWNMIKNILCPHVRTVYKLQGKKHSAQFHFFLYATNLVCCCEVSATSLKWVLMWIFGGESVKEPNVVFKFMKGFPIQSCLFPY